MATIKHAKQLSRARRVARTSRKKVAHHYRRTMPNAKWKRVVVWGAFLVWASVTALQLLYPVDRTLPRASLSGQSMAYLTFDEAVKRSTDAFTNTRIIVDAGGKEKVEAKLADIGAEPELERMALILSDYPLWMRCIPFSLVVHVPTIDTASLRYTPSILQRFARETSFKLTTKPENARLAIEQGKLIAHGDTPGRTVDAKQLEQKLMQSSVRLGRAQSITIEPRIASANTTAADIEAVRAKAQRALARKVTIVANGVSREVPNTTVASWLKIRTADDGAVEVAMSEEAFHGYVDGLNKEVGKPAGTTNITIINGIETGRTNGEPGQQIDEIALRQNVSDYLLSDTLQPTPIEVIFVSTPPGVIYNSRYTSSQEGLQAYVSDIAKSRGVNVVVRQLDAPGWSAQANADVSTVSASTYKLYVALMLFDKMDRGETNWNDPMLDTTVSGCFDRMTIASTNPCAEQWLAQWGRTNVNNFVYAHGFSRGTTFISPIAVHTTAQDLAKYMIGLEDGRLMSGMYRDRLLRSLSSHPYRAGVPAGSAGKVWNKVGFLWNYVHDAAIVHHPRGRYVIVVMTGGGSYSRIATITREVEKILYP